LERKNTFPFFGEVLIFRIPSFHRKYVFKHLVRRQKFIKTSPQIFFKLKKIFFYKKQQKNDLFTKSKNWYFSGLGFSGFKIILDVSENKKRKINFYREK
jgi:hypothetical protein